MNKRCVNLKNGENFKISLMVSLLFHALLGAWILKTYHSIHHQNGTMNAPFMVSIQAGGALISQRNNTNNNDLLYGVSKEQSHFPPHIASNSHIRRSFSTSKKIIILKKTLPHPINSHLPHSISQAHKVNHLKVSPQKFSKKTISREARSLSHSKFQTPHLDYSSTNIMSQKQGLSTALSDYFSKVSAWLERFKQYPDEEGQKREAGTVLISFIINSQGKVLSFQIRRSSGSSILDNAAKSLIERANPLPPPPTSWHRNSLKMLLPITYTTD